MTEPQWAERSDWSPLPCRNHVKAAQDLPELERPRKRRRAA